MKAFLLNLWNGEPVFVFGIVSVAAVAVNEYGGLPEWFGAVTLAVVAINTFLQRNKVTPVD
jgi:uncharacterized membrane protein YkvI